MTKTYSITREHAAKMLNVSTRTIDRYIKSWRVSYKKIANKVLLEKSEVLELQNEYSALHQEINTEIVKEPIQTVQFKQNSSLLEDAIDEKIDKFFLIFKEKDKILEEKNNVIFMLQRRVSELETKLNHMVALPDYNQQKQEALLEKQKLEGKIKELSWIVKTEKNKNLILIWLALIFTAIAGFLLTK